MENTQNQQIPEISVFQKILMLFRRKKHIHTYGYVDGAIERRTFKSVFDTVTFEAIE